MSHRTAHIVFWQEAPGHHSKMSHFPSHINGSILLLVLDAAGVETLGCTTFVQSTLCLQTFCDVTKRIYTQQWKVRKSSSVKHHSAQWTSNISKRKNIFGYIIKLNSFLRLIVGGWIEKSHSLRKKQLSSLVVRRHVTVVFWPFSFIDRTAELWQETGLERGEVTCSKGTRELASNSGPLQQGQSLCTWDAALPTELNGSS